MKSFNSKNSSDYLMDKRRDQRFIKRVEIKFTSGDQTFSGLSSDLSENGLFIRTRNSFVPDTILEMQLYAPDGKVSFLVGIVRRSIKIPIVEFKNGMGIELIEKDAVYHNLVRLLDKKMRDQEEGSAIETGAPDSKIVSCPSCNTKNKIPVDKISMEPRCGKCRMPLIIGLPPSQDS